MGLKIFKDWEASFNEHHPENKCPSGVLLSDDAEEVAKWLHSYVLGMRKTNGKKYPPCTLHIRMPVDALFRDGN